MRLASDDLVVATEGLSKRYERLVALRALTLQVPAGAVYLLVGPNGAGKSTTIKILLDLVRPTEGDIRVFGLRPAEHSAEVHANVGYVPERTEWGYGWMRVGRLLQHHARYFPRWDESYAARLFKAFDIRLEQKMGTLSKGQSRRVHLVMALAHRPPLLILDEPTDGLDPVMRDETIRVLADHLSDTPTSVLLSTHHVSEVETLADHVGVLAGGELRAQMSLDSLRTHLRRYRAEIPPGWSGEALLGGSLGRRVTTRNEIEWTMWGSEGEVLDALAQAGATVRSVSPLGLEEATLALLTKPETSR